MVATKNTNFLWQQGKIPYQLNGNPYQSDIVKAMRQIERWCGVRFTPRQGETDYLEFSHTGGNSNSAVGCVGGGQKIVVDKSFIALHELLHAVGLIHEQQRSDRDKWIKLTSECQYPDGKDFKKRVDSNNWTAYDRLSVSHYPSPGSWGSKSGKDNACTMTFKPDPKEKLGAGPNASWQRLSELDKQGLGAIYNIRLRNDSDKVVSWFCYDSTDTDRFFALASGELKANGGNTFYLPPDPKIDSYAIDFKVFLRAVGSPATVSRGGQLVTLVANGRTTTVSDYRTYAPVPTPPTRPIPPTPQSPPATGPLPTAGGDVTGHNMAEVTFGSAGRPEGMFRQMDEDRWVETDAAGAVRFHFVERQRDDWSVYLADDSRGYGIQLDVFKNRVRVNTATAPWARLYTIIDARRGV